MDEESEPDRNRSFVSALDAIEREIAEQERQFIETPDDMRRSRRSGSRRFWSANVLADGPRYVNTGICEVSTSSFNIESSWQPVPSSGSMQRTTTSGFRCLICEYARSTGSTTRTS